MEIPYAGQDEAPADGGTEQPEGAGHPNTPKERPVETTEKNTTDYSKTRRQTNRRKKLPDDKRRADAAKLQKEKTTRQSAEIFTERQTPDASRPGRQTGTSAANGTGTGKHNPLRRKEHGGRRIPPLPPPGAERRRRSAPAQPPLRSKPVKTSVRRQRCPARRTLPGQNSADQKPPRRPSAGRGGAHSSKRPGI